jgi:hypothetical protein
LNLDDPLFQRLEPEDNSSPGLSPDAFGRAKINRCIDAFIVQMYLAASGWSDDASLNDAPIPDSSLTLRCRGW